MKLTEKQKRWINTHKVKYSSDKMSKMLGISEDEINNVLNFKTSNKSLQKSAPKIFYFFLIIIPILFFVILELTLKGIDYGINTEQWITDSRGKLTANPNIAHRYFYNTKYLPETIGDVFDKEKKFNSFRVFVMGESSTAGYPYMPIGSFSRYIRKRLEIVYPESNIEVVNIAMAAVNSYTIRDLLHGVIEQRPDLILIYSGHNEYYGALGVGSQESFGSSRFLVNTALYLNRFKTFELLRNLIKSIMNLFSSDPIEDPSGTLMSKVVKDQYISFNSDKFNAGINQFEGNMRDVLQMIKENNIPVILGTVASNLKDQPPFISVKDERYPSAEELFRNAENLLTQGINIEAAKEFKKAKDLDVLRFRAPEEINIKIKKLCKEFSITIVDIDSVFNALSPHGITGSNLMTDHLHPTLEGYQLIGRLYYDQMEKLNLLPKTNKTIDNNLVQDSLTRAEFSFSELDSVIAVFEIKALKNDWPFTGKNKSRPLNLLFERNNILDSTAADVITGRLTWEDAQKKIAEWYLFHKDISSFKKQMDVLISQFPFTLELYDLTVGRLLKLKEYDGAYEFLSRRYKIEPNGSAAKWLGIYDLTRGNTDKAIQYLEESLRFNQNEPLVLYNLSCAYSSKKEYNKALGKINLCLSYNPDYKEAKIMQSQLISLIK